MYFNDLSLNETFKKYYFEPFSTEHFKGYRRIITLQKSGILGKIAEYKLLDYILLEADLNLLLKSLSPIRDVMIQRFLLPGEGKMIRKSFALGLLGWAYVGFLEGKEKYFEDLRDIYRRALWG